MKKLSPRYRRWLMHRALQEFRKKRAQRTSLAPITGIFGTVQVRLGREHEAPPDTLCFDENFDGTMKFLSAVRRRWKLRMRGVIPLPSRRWGARTVHVKGHYDFSKIKRISTSAALVLAAEFDRSGRLTGRAPGAIRLQEWHPEVGQILRELGFFELLQIEQGTYEEDDNNSRMILKFRSGSKVDATQISGPDSVIETLFGFIGQNQSMETNVYSAVIEAMNNVRDHAYPERYFHGVRHVKDWWLTGAADRTTRRLTLSLYDQGITIPVSLPNTWGLPEVIRSFLERFGLKYDPTDFSHDGRAIETAMVAFRSSTGKAYRGLGLANIRKFVEGLPGGKLRILSRCGEYLMLSGGQPEIRTHDVPLEGTLVEIEANF